MFSEGNCVQELQQKLQTVTKKKCFVELELISIRSNVVTQSEELARVKEEIEMLKLDLQVLYENINGGQKQLSVIEMCKACDKTKVEAYLKTLKCFKEQYQDLFDKEKELIERKHTEQKRKQEDSLEKKREQQLQVMKQNEEQMKEILAIETECDALERECIVLKKRNKAIMLKLQRTLIEKEDARRNQKENKCKH